MILDPDGPRRHDEDGALPGVLRATARASSLALVTTVSIAWGLVLAVAAYAGMRLVEVIRVRQPDPAEVTWSAHSGFLWRVWTVLYGAGLLAVAISLLVGARPRMAARALAPAVAVATAMLLFQSALFP